MNDITEYKDFFKKIAKGDAEGKGNHKEINDFCFGVADTLQAKIRSNATYPILMVEVPDIEPSGQRDSHFQIYNGSMIILTQAPKGDEEAEENAWELTERLTKEVMGYMLWEKRKKAGIGEFFFDNTRIEPVDAFTADNLFGWRATFRVSGCFNLKFDVNKWNLV